MNIKLRAASNLLTAISIFSIAVALVYFAMEMFGDKTVIYTIISGLLVYALYCFYRIFLTIEEMKESRKNNSTK